MTTVDLESGIKDALARVAADVPYASVKAVADKRYAPRTLRLASKVMIVGIGVDVAVGAAAMVTWNTASTKSVTRISAKPVAYIGSDPRLVVGVLPPGYAPGPDIPVPTLPGQPIQPGLLPSKTFVKGTGGDQESIIVSEGADGVGPVPKLLAFAAEHPSIVSSVTENGQEMTVVNLAAIGAGSNAVIYFQVSDSSWALIGATPNVPLSDLLTVAAGVGVDGS